MSNPRRTKRLLLSILTWILLLIWLVLLIYLLLDKYVPKTAKRIREALKELWLSLTGNKGADKGETDSDKTDTDDEEETKNVKSRIKKEKKEPRSVSQLSVNGNKREDKSKPPLKASEEGVTERQGVGATSEESSVPTGPEESILNLPNEESRRPRPGPSKASTDTGKAPRMRPGGN